MTYRARCAGRKGKNNAYAGRVASFHASLASIVRSFDVPAEMFFGVERTLDTDREHGVTYVTAPKSRG